MLHTTKEKGKGLLFVCFFILSLIYYIICLFEFFILFDRYICKKSNRVILVDRIDQIQSKRGITYKKMM